jgi:hypothetical protein
MPLKKYSVWPPFNRLPFTPALLTHYLYLSVKNKNKEQADNTLINRSSNQQKKSSSGQRKNSF